MAKTISPEEKLILKVKKYSPKVNADLILSAYNFAKTAHLGQKRLSGDPVFSHPLAVANTLTDWRLDSVSIAAGLLHDTVEDANITLEQIKKKFGNEVAMIVNGVTKIGEIKLRSSEEEFLVENLRKMILVMAKDLRVVMVKLADRLHNMQTLNYLPPEKQKRIATETLEVYAPLAERLGIGEIKGKLEDLAFPYVYPQDYEWVKNYSAAYYLKAEDYISRVKGAILLVLDEENIRAQVNGRTKHLHSLWRKLLRPEINKDIIKIHDLVALRILVKSVRDCYATLGAIHKNWKPVPSVGIRDFIAQPKPNGYRSIHTTVFAIDGRISEFQIRTFQMHDEAENGIAAHWHYAQEKCKNMSDAQLEKGVFAPDEKLSWVKQLVAWQREIVDSREYLNALKFDALKHRIFVFSPSGDAFDLPTEATPVDFAYQVHSDLGAKTVGAKVNGRLVALDYKLKSGEMVEIMTDKNKKGPSRDWLEFTTTHSAKKKIISRLKQNQ